MRRIAILIFALASLASGSAAQISKEHRNLLTEHLQADYKLMYMQPEGGAFIYPYLRAGSKNYSRVLWDWDSWLCDVALRQIITDVGNDADREEALVYEQGCVKNYLAYTSLEDGYMPMVIDADSDPSTFFRPKRSSASIYLNCLMYRELQAMAYLARKLNLHAEGSLYDREARRLREAVREHCWDERDGMYYSVDLNLRPFTGQPEYIFGKTMVLHEGAPRSYPCLIQRLGSWVGFMTMWAGIATNEQAKLMVEKNLTDERTFWASYGVRTLSRMEKMYNLRATHNPSNWQGPIWGISNYIVFRGLVNYGFTDEARQMVEKTAELFGEDLKADGALHEYYNPETGEPIMGKGFQNWNYLVLNMLAWYDGRPAVREYQPVQTASAYDSISSNRYMAASNYFAYPKPKGNLTPAPKGKHPFYISHYGRHGSRYLDNRKGYDIPYRYLHNGDSLGKLSPLGKTIMNCLAEIIHDAEDKWGTLSPLGIQQHRDIARRMTENFPEIFRDTAYIDARSTIVPRCIRSMESALSQLKDINPSLRIHSSAAKENMRFLNYQDRHLRDSMMTYAAKRAYNAYIEPLKHNSRVMYMLFNDSAYAREKVGDYWLPYYVLKASLMQQNTKNVGSQFVELYTDEEIYHFWQNENSWWYIMYGPSLLNGGNQPYTQRYLLKQIIADADSCLSLDHPSASLRYGHETVLLPLVCLLNLNGYGYKTLHLEELEAHNWWACKVFPMGANIQFVFYRKNQRDQDIVFKVLLNEQEATLPLPTSNPPYYHWSDFRKYCLDIINAYHEQ